MNGKIIIFYLLHDSWSLSTYQYRIKICDINLEDINKDETIIGELEIFPFKEIFLRDYAYIIN